MDVAVLQLAARHGRPKEALARARALATAKRADLFLLPEASLTGYVGVARDGRTLDFDLTRFAEPLAGPTSEALAALARDTQAYVAGPLVERSADGAHNAFVVFDRDGRRVAHYRKRHPWYPEAWATAGLEDHPVFDVDGVPTTLAICFDLHFLEDEAARALDRADLLLFPSAWVEEEDSREATFVRLARAHSVAIANANWGEGDVAVSGQGGSMIVDARGEVLARAGLGEARLDASFAGRVPGRGLR